MTTEAISPELLNDFLSCQDLKDFSYQFVDELKSSTHVPYPLRVLNSVFSFNATQSNQGDEKRGYYEPGQIWYYGPYNNQRSWYQVRDPKPFIDRGYKRISINQKLDFTTSQIFPTQTVEKFKVETVDVPTQANKYTLECEYETSACSCINNKGEEIDLNDPRYSNFLRKTEQDTDVEENKSKET